MFQDKQGQPVTTKKALALALLALMAGNGEISPAAAQNAEKGFALTGRSLTHRIALDNGQRGIQEILFANTSRVLGITDFDKKKPFEQGAYFITHITLATTEPIAAKDDSSLAVANFVRRMKEGDAFLQSTVLTIKINGSVQPVVKIRLGDIMISQADNETNAASFELPQGFYLTDQHSIDMHIENPQGNLGIPNEQFKGVEFNFEGMFASI